MQPRPTEIPQSSSDNPRPSNSSISTQHGQQGFAGSPGSVALPHDLDTGADLNDTASTTADGSQRSQHFGARPVHSQDADNGGVNQRKQGKRTPSPVDRIIEHERASPKYVSSRETSTGFRVVSRSKHAPASRLSLHDLPAEVLTHVCSYLPADSFSAMSLVSQKIHRLVTEQHAWRMAFARYFPGHESLMEQIAIRSDRAGDELLVTEKRHFTRLTALSSWRSEYIIRTRLLRSLSKGSPSDLDQLTAKITSRAGNKATRLSQVDYNVDMDCPVTSIEGTFELKNNRPHIRLIHSSSEDCRSTLSNPLECRHISWSFQSAFLQFYERFSAAEMYGLGTGDVVGVPNTIEISPYFGMLMADGTPGGRIYHRHLDEQRGNFLARSVNDGSPELGIPRIDPTRESMTAAWLSKTKNIPVITNGLIGALVGTSTGTILACSLGTDSNSALRTGPANVSARWVLSPGVPIIAFAIDEQYSARRHQQNRIWAFALNALGEVYYLKSFPNAAPSTPSRRQLSDWEINANAWQAGRTVYWDLIEATRRKSKPDPFGESEVDGSYSVRSSAQSHGLSPEQVAAETREIEAFMLNKPLHFRNTCEGWDMQRRLEVDFAGDDSHGAGESIFVINCGLNEGQTASIQRYSRLLIEDAVRVEEGGPAQRDSIPSSPALPAVPSSIFGGPAETEPPPSVWNVQKPETVRRLSRTSSEGTIPEERFEVWRQSNCVFGELKAVQITTSARDKSIYAGFTIDEDPLLSLNPVSTTWSPTASPLAKNSKFGNATDIPGQRARFFAIGTKIGTVVVWNMRSAISSSAELVNDIEPVCVIHTESPGISSLAISALYLVHGGNDGLVQAWDPLASTKEPVRTLHSKFTQRARRDLRLNQARPQGVGINYYAAGAICLDPDPKVLRGVVGIGNKLRYWSYSSSAADSYRGSKRRSQRDRRSSNHGGTDPKVTRTGRGALADYIANEQADLERAKRARDKATSRFKARFGTNLLGEGATDDEIMAYATMISEESYASDNARRMSITSSSASSVAGSPGVSLSYPPSVPEEAEGADAEIARALEREDEQLAEALRLSLQESGAQETPEREVEHHDTSSDSGNGNGNFIVRYAKGRKGKRSPKGKSPTSTGSIGSPMYAAAGSSTGASRQAEADDLEYALQLSLAEEQSRRELEEEFPSLRVRQTPSPPLLSGSSTSESGTAGEGKGKGKGKGRGQ